MEEIQQYNNKIISSELIFLDCDYNNQDDALRFMVKNATDLSYVVDEKVMFNAVKKREQEVSTAIGYDIAIPHGKSETVTNPFIAFLRTKNKFKWAEENEEVVRLIFLIGVPKESEGKLHLKFISQLSKKLLNDEFRDRLTNQNDKDKIFDLLNTIEIKGGK